MPLVSIITCTYNRAHLIGDTIRSILNQRFRDFEYIIVDDSSTDDTDSMVNSFPDDRIRYFRMPQRSGYLGKLKNFGIAKSSGQYIAFVDSDDIWLPDKLFEQVSFLEKSDAADFSFTDVELFDSAHTIRAGLLGKDGHHIGSVLPELLRNKLPICATTLVFRAKCLRKTGPLLENSKSSDFDFILNLSTHFSAYAIFKPLVRVRRHDQNITNFLPSEKAQGILDSYLKLIDRGIVKQGQLDRMLCRLCYSFAVEFLRQGNHRFAVYFLKRSISFDAFYWKNYPRIILAFFRSRLQHSA